MLLQRGSSVRCRRHPHGGLGRALCARFGRSARMAATLEGYPCEDSARPARVESAGSYGRAGPGMGARPACGDGGSRSGRGVKSRGMRRAARA